MATADRSTQFFEVVTAAHHFLLRVIPFRKPACDDALREFVAIAEGSGVSPIELDAVLLRCLVVLNRHATFSVPTLIERYINKARSIENCLLRFADTVDEAIRYHSVRNRIVQEAIDLINIRYAESGCTPGFVADMLNVRLSTLDVAFKREIDRSPAKYIRDVRLQRSAILLAVSKMSIKEIWTSIGYNDHSNYDHDFKDRFGITPSGYRARAVGPLAREVYNLREAAENPAPRGGQSPRKQKVLIVDDDEMTRVTLGKYLELEGYRVVCAATGADGVRTAAEQAPEVILLDYHLGDTDGLQVLREIRSHSKRYLPGVALFTADFNITERAAEVSALDAIIVSKLCDLDRIGEVVVQLSGGGS